MDILKIVMIALEKYDGRNMQRIMEVYELTEEFRPQVDQHRAGAGKYF